MTIHFSSYYKEGYPFLQRGDDADLLVCELKNNLMEFHDNEE